MKNEGFDHLVHFFSCPNYLYMNEYWLLSIVREFVVKLEIVPNLGSCKYFNVVPLHRLIHITVSS